MLSYTSEPNTVHPVPLVDRDAFDDLSVDDLLAFARDQDITLTLDGERLRVSAPKGALSLELKRAIGNRKSELVEALSLRGRIRPRTDGYAGAYPVSFAQERLWFLDQLEGPSAVYNVPVAVRLRGPLALDVLQKSLDALIERHTVLRTTFSVEDGVPLQSIAAVETLPLRSIDLRGKPIPKHRSTRPLRARPVDPFV